jgi:glycosyltransferase involved in cell wall biosynthesis
LFEKIGGFDERYKPAYKEIVDLCFSIRRLGYKVMHQPMSIVVHFEGVTGGTDINAGIKKYQEINKPKFVEKWSSVLEQDHYPPDSGNIFLAREKIAGKKIQKIILIVDDKVPDYDRYAGSLGMYQYTKLFVDLGFKVLFLPVDLRGTEPYTSELQQYGIEVVYGGFDFDSWLRRNGKHIDYAWLSRPGVATRYIEKIRDNTSAKIMYCGRDLHYLRWQRKYEVDRSDHALRVSQRLKEMELMLFNNADAILTFSTFEAEAISRELSGRGNVVIIPPYLYDEFPFEGFTADYLAPTFDDRKNIVFLGGFGHGPNVDAVVWFAKECFPRVSARLPDAKLLVIGSDPPKDVTDLQSENIAVTGHVKDLKQYFQKMKLCVAPVRWGAGVKGKIVTSMYYGVPVVTTSLGAEGMELADGQHVLIADAPEDFAARVVELYSNEEVWRRLSKNSLQYVKERYSKKAALEKLLPILDLPQLSMRERTQAP